MKYLTTIKNGFINKDKKTENLIFLIILLIILLISINYIFKSDENSNSTSSEKNINYSNDEIKNNENESLEMEEKLENILSQIKGIDEVSVMLTFSTSTKQNIAYNTQEENKEGSLKVEKEVAYNEESGKKVAIVESVENPKVEGIIIVAKGANTVEIKSKIATAAAMAVNVPVYKVQVFEK